MEQLILAVSDTDVNKQVWITQVLKLVFYLFIIAAKLPSLGAMSNVAGKMNSTVSGPDSAI